MVLHDKLLSFGNVILLLPSNRRNKRRTSLSPFAVQTGSPLKGDIQTFPESKESDAR